ncbi:MAG: hypothetical protein ABJL44_14370 [Algibacter sp.]
MKNLFIALILLFTITINSQTKQETQDWIISKLTSYGAGDSERYGVVFNEKTGVLVVLDKYKVPFGRIAIISLLENITIREVEQNMWLTLTGKEKSIVTGIWDFNKNEMVSPEAGNSTDIILSISFKENDLPERMEKAFKHLVKLYGGEIKKEAF